MGVDVARLASPLRNLLSSVSSHSNATDEDGPTPAARPPGAERAPFTRRLDPRDCAIRACGRPAPAGPQTHRHRHFDTPLSGGDGPGRPAGRREGPRGPRSDEPEYAGQDGMLRLLRDSADRGVMSPSSPVRSACSGCRETASTEE